MQNYTRIEKLFKSGGGGGSRAVGGVEGGRVRGTGSERGGGRFERLTKGDKRRNIIAATIFIILPLVLGAAFLAQQYRSNASVVTRPEQFHAERVSATAAQVTFVTAQSVKATILCAVSRDGVKFFCGEDAAPTTQHSILTSDFKVNLNTGQGYYVFSNITGDELPMGYIPADSSNPAFGLSANTYNETTLGLCYGDEEFDPQLDVNQDGCVYTNDLVEVY